MTACNCKEQAEFLKIDQRVHIKCNADILCEHALKMTNERNMI